MGPDDGPRLGRNESPFNKHIKKNVFVVIGYFCVSFSFLVYLNLSKQVPEHSLHIAPYLPSSNSLLITDILLCNSVWSHLLTYKGRTESHEQRFLHANW